MVVTDCIFLVKESVTAKLRGMCKKFVGVFRVNRGSYCPMDNLLAGCADEFALFYGIPMLFCDVLLGGAKVCSPAPLVA